MDRASKRASAVERATIDLVEAVTLVPQVGATFAAEIVEVDNGVARIQIADPPVSARVRVTRAGPGDIVTVRLASADPASRSISFEQVT